MKIVTWNVNGIRARAAQVQEFVAAEKPDVLCLQEIKATCEQVPQGLCEMEGYWCRWHGGAKGYSGVGLHMRRETFPEEPRFAHPSFDFENRIVTVQCGDLTIASIYVPNGGKDFPAKMSFLEAMNAYVAAREGELILCGDLNVARADIDVHPRERRPVTGQLPEERELFQQMLNSGMTDLGRAFEPDNAGLFTWWAPWRNMRARNIGWRLDYVLASEALMRRAVSCVVQREFGTSDHAPVVAVFA